VGFVHFYVFPVTVGVLNNAHYKMCSTCTVLYLACNWVLIKWFVFQQLAVHIVTVTCCRWHKSWPHVQGICWCAIAWLGFVTEPECVYCVVRTESLTITQVTPSLYICVSVFITSDGPVHSSSPSALPQTACAVFRLLANVILRHTDILKHLCLRLSVHVA